MGSSLPDIDGSIHESRWTWKPDQDYSKRTMSDRSARHPRVVHFEDVEVESLEHGTRFAGERRRLGFAAGSQRLGASHLVVPPGKAAWPAHYHAGNEEAIYVLEGQGRLRVGEDIVEVRAGDWIALPAEPEAHQLHNPGPDDLVYLCLSTQNDCDICVYPDSDKVGLFGGAAPGAALEARYVRGFYPQDAKVPYYAGEDD